MIEHVLTMAEMTSSVRKRSDLDWHRRQANFHLQKAVHSPQEGAPVSDSSRFVGANSHSNWDLWYCRSIHLSIDRSIYLFKHRCVLWCRQLAHFSDGLRCHCSRALGQEIDVLPLLHMMWYKDVSSKAPPWRHITLICCHTWWCTHLTTGVKLPTDAAKPMLFA